MLMLTKRIDSVRRSTVICKKKKQSPISRPPSDQSNPITTPPHRHHPQGATGLQPSGPNAMPAPSKPSSPAPQQPAVSQPPASSATAAAAAAADTGCPYGGLPATHLTLHRALHTGWLAEQRRLLPAHKRRYAGVMPPVGGGTSGWLLLYGGRTDLKPATCVRLSDCTWTLAGGGGGEQQQQQQQALPASPQGGSGATGTNTLQ